MRPGNPSRLLVGFSSPVNPTIDTEPGRVRLTFRREPVVAAGPDKVTYTDPLITGASFSEHDGIAELDITGTAALMANFADGGKTIIVTGAPAPPPPVAEQAPAPQPALPGTPAAAPQPRQPAAPRFLVLIDPAHGGADIGAAITPSLPEKDVVLALARRVQRELNSRGIAAGIATQLRCRDCSRPARGVSQCRPSGAVRCAACRQHRPRRARVHRVAACRQYLATEFLPWDTAQAAFLDLSGTVAGSVAAELEYRKLPNATLFAPLRPMNSIAAPAIAVEIAPPSENVEEIASAAYQEQVAQSIAAGIAAVRSSSRRCARDPATAGDASACAGADRRLGLGVYAWHLKRKVARDAQLAAQQQLAMAPAGNGPPTAVTLYVASDSDATLRKSQVSVALPPESVGAREGSAARPIWRIFAASIAPPYRRRRGCARRLSAGGRHGRGGHQLRFRRCASFGVLAEELTVASIVATLNANDSKIQRVKILVNGQERETLAGHADLQRFYRASNIGQVMKDMQ